MFRNRGAKMKRLGTAFGLFLLVVALKAPVMAATPEEVFGAALTSFQRQIGAGAFGQVSARFHPDYCGSDQTCRDFRKKYYDASKDEWSLPGEVLLISVFPAGSTAAVVAQREAEDAVKGYGSAPQVFRVSWGDKPIFVLYTHRFAFDKTARPDVVLYDMNGNFFGILESGIAG